MTVPETTGTVSIVGVLLSAFGYTITLLTRTREETAMFNIDRPTARVRQLTPEEATTMFDDDDGATVIGRDGRRYSSHREARTAVSRQYELVRFPHTPTPRRPPTMMKKSLLFLTFAVGCVLAANWATNKWGMVPVGFGLSATAGTYAAGLSFGVRDALHEVAGRWVVLAAILTGAALSAFVSPGLALASGVAFLFSETADLCLYEPLRQRNWAGAVVASNVAGATIDTVLFLWLVETFTDIPFIELNWETFNGQMVGKALMILPALVLVGWLRRSR